MTAREMLEAQELRDALLAAWPICPVCGSGCTTQLAHRIGQTKRNVRTLGKSVVHHRFNLVPVCGLECNGRVAIDFKPVLRRDLIANIHTDLEGMRYLLDSLRDLVAYEVIEETRSW